MCTCTLIINFHNKYALYIHVAYACAWTRTCNVLYFYRSYDATGESRIGQLRGQVDEVCLSLFALMGHSSSQCGWDKMT